MYPPPGSGEGTAPGAPYGYPPTMPGPPPYWAPQKPRLWANATVAWVVAGVLAVTVVGLSVGLASKSSTSPAAVPPRTSSPLPGRGGAGGFLGSLAVVGTVNAVEAHSFTVTDRTGATVTVNEQSSTTYYNGRTSATASAVVSGARVLVQGSRSGSTVTATSVVVRQGGGLGGFLG